MCLWAGGGGRREGSDRSAREAIRRSTAPTERRDDPEEVQSTVHAKAHSSAETHDLQRAEPTGRDAQQLEAVAGHVTASDRVPDEDVGGLSS